MRYGWLTAVPSQGGFITVLQNLLISSAAKDLLNQYTALYYISGGNGGDVDDQRAPSSFGSFQYLLLVLLPVDDVPS